ncbi:hypothetical protein TUM17576_38650 [Enterobacter hormaechei]|nr:hypothetical protein [Enterobacter hormaechei]GJL37045.1 hypothetical protein TUM17576_38650 [Enterobacter hormaechei]
MEQSDDLRSQWLAAGWKRGAFIRLDTNANLVDELPGKLVACIDDKKSVFIVPILYDCALVELDFDKEPWAQVLVIWETDLEKAYENGKNPRKLHLKAKNNGQDVCFEISALSFAQIDRAALLKAVPDSSLTWLEGGLELLLDWVAARYRQATFPDSFNQRLGPIQNGLERLWKSASFSQYASGVYIQLNSFDELEENTPYSVDVMIVVPYTIKGKEFREFMNKESNTMVTKLKSLLNTIKSIHVVQVQTISEREFTKELERKYSRFSLEYYSFRKSPKTNPVPAESASAFLFEKGE